MAILVLVRSGNGLLHDGTNPLLTTTLSSTNKGFWHSPKEDCGGYIIQIKICAEYRDMLPRPRLVCQEPGLRPIGRSPGVPDKSSRGLGSMSRYSAQILICFIAYIFSIFNFSVGLVGNLAELPPCTVPPATVIRMRLLSAHQTIKSPSMPCWGAAGRNTLWHSCHRTGEISR